MLNLGGRTKIRVQNHRKRALEEGWQLSELARMLICLGSTSYFLRLRHPEASEGFKLLAAMSKADATVGMALGRRRACRNEPKHIGKMMLLPVHLPRGFYDLISTCSATTGRSGNSFLSQFIEAGYLTYMLGQNTLLKTLRSLHGERQELFSGQKF